MFEKLFKRNSTIKRHRQGPLSEQRRRYLTFKAEGGAARSTLCTTAGYILAVADRMALGDKTTISLEAIEAAANSWARSPSKRNPTRELGSCQHFVQEFAQYMVKERGFSPRTIAGYSWCVKNFLNRLAVQGKTLRGLNVKSVEDVFSWLGHKGYTRRGIQAYAQPVRAFLRYSEERGWCALGIAVAIIVPRAFRQERLPSGPSWADVQRLLASTETKNPKDIRDHAILLLLAVYGLRVDEVRQLQLEDIDWERELLLIRGSKQRRARVYPLRVYPLSQSTGNAILRYLRDVRPRTKERTLFLRIRSPYRSLGVGGLWTIVGRRVRRLGIVVQHPGPHCLRHACATRLLAQGLSFKEIGDHLGHRSLESTKIYAKVDLASLREVGNFDLGGLL